VLEPGRYVVAVGASSRDLRGSTEVELEGEEVRVPLTLNSTLGEAMASPVVAQALGDATGALTGGDEGGGEALGVDLAVMMGSIPLDRLVGFSAGQVSTGQLQQLLDAANHAQ
jgi:beta-glucosidase